MAVSVNKVVLIGNLGAGPEVRTFQAGAVCAISAWRTGTFMRLDPYMQLWSV